MGGRWISIHALLAESDARFNDDFSVESGISIHALLAESDNQMYKLLEGGIKFLSTLSLRRATLKAMRVVVYVEFLSTLSLRRAT